MTENDETSPCCFEETCGHNRNLRVCTARDFNRNDCSKNIAVKEQFITLMTFPQGKVQIFVDLVFRTLYLDPGIQL